MPVPEKEAVTKVCIDDFAFRKRKTYGTIMVDIGSAKAGRKESLSHPED